MSNGWIKMRSELLDHPRVVAISRTLQDNKEFREWLTPGGGGSKNGQIASNEALRYVTTAALLKLWSLARTHGKFDGLDLHLPYNTLTDLDEMGGCPGLGEAMALVGWAVEEYGVILPNFKEHNAPMTNAERQKRYRDKAKESVTEALRNRYGE